MARGKVRTPKFRFVMNTCGSKLLIPDLGPHGIELEINEKVDLTEEFSIEEINKSHGLYSACKKSKATDEMGNKVPWLTCFKTKQEMVACRTESPTPILNVDDEGTLHIKEGHRAKESFEAEPNVFDDKLVEEDEKDKRLEERAYEKAGRPKKKRRTRKDKFNATKNKSRKGKDEEHPWQKDE